MKIYDDRDTCKLENEKLYVCKESFVMGMPSALDVPMCFSSFVCVAANCRRGPTVLPPIVDCVLASL